MHYLLHYGWDIFCVFEWNGHKWPWQDSLEALWRRSSCAALIPLVEAAEFGCVLTADCGVNSAAAVDPADDAGMMPLTSRLR